MPDVTTDRALLLNELQDLHDAERALAGRLEDVVAAVCDADVAALLDGYRTRAVPRSHALAALADGSVTGADNIWISGVLDDADRDIDTVETGRLLDIALVGAMRKGAQAARVSYETAIALARRIGQPDSAERLTDLRNEHGGCDDDLARTLARLTGRAA